MTFGLYDTFANPQECHIIREDLYGLVLIWRSRSWLTKQQPKTKSIQSHFRDLMPCPVQGLQI